MDLLETRIVELTAQLGHSTTEKETKTLELDSYRSKNHKLEQQLRELDKSKLQAIMVRWKCKIFSSVCYVEVESEPHLQQVILSENLIV